LLRQLRQVSDAWLTLERRRERGFTLGQFTEGYVARCPVLALESAEGRVDAFINLIPDSVPGEMTFDLMRHRPDAPNGAMDFLMMRLIQHAQAQGFRRVSLGMVPLVDAESGPDMAWRERALALLTERLGRFFDAASLWRYKDKFGPTWEPRFLVYQHHARLPSIGLAIARLTEGSSVEVSSLPTPAATSRSDAA
jgi:phosphatidylglycerol lysyltransferase